MNGYALHRLFGKLFTRFFAAMSATLLVAALWANTVAWTYKLAGDTWDAPGLLWQRTFKPGNEPMCGMAYMMNRNRLTDLPGLSLLQCSSYPSAAINMRLIRHGRIDNASNTLALATAGHWWRVGVRTSASTGLMLTLHSVWLWGAGLVSSVVPIVSFLRRRCDSATDRCRQCGYDLAGLTNPRCPECGSLLGDPEPERNRSPGT